MTSFSVCISRMFVNWFYAQGLSYGDNEIPFYLRSSLKIHYVFSGFKCASLIASEIYQEQLA